MAEMSRLKRPRPKCPWPKCPTFIEIMVKCSHHARTSNKKCEKILMQLYWEIGTYSHSGIELYIHYHKVYSG